MTPGISCIALLDWIAAETNAYKRWFTTRPASIWSLPTGLSAGSGTVRDLLVHVYTVDLRYSERLLGMPVTDHAAAAAAAADPVGLFALARRGQSLLRQAVNQEDLDWAAQITSVTRSAGTLVASRRKVLAHTLTHHIRHLGQIAMVLRQHGHPTDWTHDLILSDAFI
jgi:uncharacterized damage-inducible protein DinB